MANSSATCRPVGPKCMPVVFLKSPNTWIGFAAGVIVTLLLAKALGLF